MRRFVAEPEVLAWVVAIRRDEPVYPVDPPESARHWLSVSRTATRAIALEHHWILLTSEHGSPHSRSFVIPGGDGRYSARRCPALHSLLVDGVREAQHRPVT